MMAGPTAVPAPVAIPSPVVMPAPPAIPAFAGMTGGSAWMARGGLRVIRAAAILISALCLAATSAAAQDRPRARDLGVPFDGTPGPLNAITDVAGVEVGHVTLISGSGRLVVGEGPVRTGVTAILPRGRTGSAPVFAGTFVLNGNGEMTGTAWVQESGMLEGPVMITNTHSVGIVRDAVVAWRVANQPGFLWALPVVAETWDGILNDLNGFHVRQEHALRALEDARSGPVAEGAVGGGTGMRCHGFKGGIGTSSRVTPEGAGGYTLGVLVQCNYGVRDQLRIAGVPVGREFTEPTLCYAGAEPPSRAFLSDLPPCGGLDGGVEPDLDLGSIIVVVATDAPLLPHQLERLARRVTLGLGRHGSIASNGSGDLFIAFSTANPHLPGDGETAVTAIPNEEMDALFLATVQATEESITNAMVAAETMTGADDVRAYALPHDRLREMMSRHRP
jgi:D-aminopeptidase